MSRDLGERHTTSSTTARRAGGVGARAALGSLICRAGASVLEAIEGRLLLPRQVCQSKSGYLVIGFTGLQERRRVRHARGFRTRKGRILGWAAAFLGGVPQLPGGQRAPADE